MTKPKEALQSRRVLRNRETERYTDTENIDAGTNATMIPESPAKTSNKEKPELKKVCIYIFSFVLENIRFTMKYRRMLRTRL